MEKIIKICQLREALPQSLKEKVVFIHIFQSVHKTTKTNKLCAFHFSTNIFLIPGKNLSRVVGDVPGPSTKLPGQDSLSVKRVFPKHSGGDSAKLI